MFDMCWVYVIYPDVLAQYTHVLVLHIHIYLQLNTHVYCWIYIIYTDVYCWIYIIYMMVIKLQVGMCMQYEYMCILREYICVHDVYPAHVKYTDTYTQYMSNIQTLIPSTCQIYRYLYLARVKYTHLCIQVKYTHVHTSDVIHV